MRVVLDMELARIYGVSTSQLNQAVKRNRRRFPRDFAFQLSTVEQRILRSQSVISSGAHGGRRTAPWAFTEHGAIMAASVLNTPRAIRMSVFVVRAFVHLRGVTAGHAEIVAHLTEIERRVSVHDRQLGGIVAALRHLLETPKRHMRTIGFHAPVRTRT